MLKNEKEDRYELKELLDSVVTIKGEVKKTSWTKGANSQPSALLVDVVVTSEKGTLTVSHAWVLGSTFDVGKIYELKCKVIRYPVYSRQSSKKVLKYGFGEIGEGGFLGDGVDPHSIAVKTIRDVMIDYSVDITPKITQSGHWQSKITKIDDSEGKIVSSEQTFNRAVEKASEVVSMLMDKNVQ